MKKILKVVLGLFTVLLFAACNNGSNDADNLARILQIIENTPDAPIDRNVELSNVFEKNIVKGTRYDFSDQAGKKAFLVVMNNNDYTTTVFRSNASENSEAIEYDYKIENENGVFYNVPFNPPVYDNNPVSDSVPMFSSNVMINLDDVQIPTTEGSHHSFYAATKDNHTNEEWASNAVLKVIGNHCYVWYKAKDGITVTEEKLQSMANTFDEIFEKETYIFGNNYPGTYYSNTNEDGETEDYSNIYIPTDQNTKVNIIVYDLFDDYEETKRNHGGTFGYFWGLDFYKQNQIFNDGQIRKTNKCECLHMDSYFLEVAAENQRSTIAHEFQHLLHFVNKKLKYGKDSPHWFNEMMSMVCEDIMQTQIRLADSASPKNRLSNFNGSFNKGFLIWRDQTDDPSDVYISYANAYAFGAYLVRNYGIDFIKELAHNNLIEQAAISSALTAINASELNFDEAFEKYYNVVLNPKGTYYSLNKEVSKTYNYATGKSATFRCTAINLYDYITIPSQYMKGDYVTSFYQASKLNDYKGPCILNNRIFNSLDQSGMFVSYLGVVGTAEDQFNPSFQITDRASSNTNVKYKIVFAN